MRKFIFLFLYIFFLHSLSAENVVKDSVRLAELTVTGSKFETSRRIIPFSVSQISQQDIQNSGHYNVLTMLSAYAPGVFVTERNILGFGVAVGGSGAINIRGIGSAPNSQVLVLIDGHPQYQGIFGHPLADAYVASDVEKVELIRGPASVLYGSNAMGGVINIITKKQSREGFSGNLQAAYGSYNTQKYALTAGFKKNRFELVTALNYGSTDGSRENTDFRIGNGYLKAGYQINSHWKATADLSLAKYDANDNGPVFAPAPFHIDILRGKAALSVDNKYERLEGSVKMYHNFGNHDLSDGWVSSDRNSGLMLFQTYHLGQHSHITGGVDAKQYGGIGNQGASANVYKTVEELAVYALFNHRILNAVDLNAGLRLENHSVYGTEWVPMAGLSYQMLAATAFKASVSKGFRSPTIMELYTYAPNPDLLPERMMNYEVSWLQSFFNNRLSTELTAFMSKGDNLIQVVPMPLPPKRQNVGAFNNKGLEFSARFMLNSHLHLHANYSFLDTDKNLLAAPRHQANLTARYAYKIFQLQVQAQHVNGLNLQINPGTNAALLTESYSLLNARFSARPLAKLELFVMGQNLLNESYQVNNGYPMPGINIHGGFNLRW